MEGMQTTRRIGSVLGIAALLGCLSLAQPAGARDGQASGLRDSVVPIVVIDPSQPQTGSGRVELAEPPEVRSVSAANGAAPGSDIAGPADVWAPFADVPLAAWFLLVTCLLCAGLGPRALRGLRDDAQEPEPDEPARAQKSHRAGLTRPRRSPG